MHLTWSLSTNGLVYDILKGTEYFVIINGGITEEYNVLMNSEELNGTTECVTYRQDVTKTAVIITGSNCNCSWVLIISRV